MPDTILTRTGIRVSKPSAKAALLLSLVLVAPSLAIADMGPPVHMQISETEEGLYTVRWRVPKALPPRAVPMPELPEACRPTGDGTVTHQPGAWLIEGEWRCEAGLAGQVVGMAYPYPDLALTTVIKVDLSSGDRFAHVLSPGDEPWRLPEGTAAPDILEAARRAALAGASHAMGSWVHLVFLVVVGSLVVRRQAILVVTGFTVGQIVGVGLTVFTGISTSAAEIGLAIGAVILARQALEPPDERRRLALVAGLAGLIHGACLAAALADNLGESATGIPAQLLAVLGMDAIHLVGGLALATLFGWIAGGSTASKPLRLVSYGAGVAGVALAIALAVTGGGEIDATAASLQIPESTVPGSGAATPGSQRVAPAAPDAPVQSFLTVEPFEIRHEAMLRLAWLAEDLELVPGSTLAVEAQWAIINRLTALVRDSATVVIDGISAVGVISRADFMLVDATGALPRPNPVPENLDTAVVGVIVRYPTAEMPNTVSLRWTQFSDSTRFIPSTVIDPENVNSSLLTKEEPVLEWSNTLTENPIPTVEAVAVEPVELPIPWLALPLLLAMVILIIAAIKGHRPKLTTSIARVVLAAAFVVGPLVQTAIALPGSAGRTPSERQARRILAGLLPNIYRAIEFRDEAIIYDRLAISVAGDALTAVYLGQRRALEVEERGGAQARVEAVEVLEADFIEPRGTGFVVRSVWTVGGMVTHFGHRHFRQNRYNALIEISAVDGTWKIESIEVLEQDRLK